MRKSILLLFILAIVSMPLFSQEYIYEPDFSWTSASVMAQGGSFIANAHGFDALMYNPSGFSSEKIEFSFSIQPYATANVFNLIDQIGSATESGNQMEYVNMVSDQITTNGLGGGAEIGVGVVGKGIGVGLFVTADAEMPQVSNLLSAYGSVYATAGLIGGYTHTFHFGDVDLSVGADLKGLYRMRSSFNSSFLMTTIMSSMMGGGEPFSPDSLPLENAFAIGGDLGTTMSWKGLSVAAVLHNVGHLWYTYYEGTTVGDMINSSTLPQTKMGDFYVTPMQLNFGVDFHPNLKKLSKYIDPRIHVSYKWDLLIGLQDKLSNYNEKTFWMGLHAGAEIKLLSFLNIRAGFNQGYFTAGLGIDFFIGELNVAIYSNEAGIAAGQEQAMGAAVEFAVRF